jgi:transposase InsO family protein
VDQRKTLVHFFGESHNSKHNYPIAPNTLNRQFWATGPNEKWVGDIVCTQMTKTNVLALGSSRYHISYLHISFSNNYPVYQ